MYLFQCVIVPLTLKSEVAHTHGEQLSPGDHPGPRTSRDIIIKLGCFMHIHDGNLCGVKMTVQVQYMSSFKWVHTITRKIKVCTCRAPEANSLSW